MISRSVADQPEALCRPVFVALDVETHVRTGLAAVFLVGAWADCAGLPAFRAGAVATEGPQRFWSSRVWDISRANCWRLAMIRS